jgi:hypothetical protein
VHDRRGVRGVVFRPGLVAEDAERHDRGVDAAVLGHDRRDHTWMRGQVVGVELHGPHRSRPCHSKRLRLRDELVCPPRRQDDGRAASQPRRQFDADLAAAAEDHHCARRFLAQALVSARRVVHGRDYVLR